MLFSFFVRFFNFYPFLLLRPIPLHGKRLIGAYLLPSTSLSLLHSLGSRSIIGFPSRKTLRFNEYYVRMRYPVLDVRIIAPNHFCIILQCYNSQDVSWLSIDVSGSLPWSFSRLNITYTMSFELVSARPCKTHFHSDNYFTDYSWRSSNAYDIESAFQFSRPTRTLPWQEPRGPRRRIISFSLLLCLPTRRRAINPFSSLLIHMTDSTVWPHTCPNTIRNVEWRLYQHLVRNLVIELDSRSKNDFGMELLVPCI